MMMMMIRTLSAVLLLGLAATQAQAESCTRSREYILADSTGDLQRQPSAYQQLFKICLETLMMSNVRDAFILKDGGIAVVPTIDDVKTTANTLAQFCQRYPGATLRFIRRGEIPIIASIGRAVQISSGSATSCRTITGTSF
jgi:hypothetical protein